MLGRTERGAGVRGTAAVVLAVSHCCISTASIDRIGLSGDQQVNQKRIWTSGSELQTEKKRKRKESRVLSVKDPLMKLKCGPFDSCSVLVH